MKEDLLEAALYLVPSLLASEGTDALPPFNKRVLRETKHFVVENRRSAIRFLRACVLDVDIDAIDFRELSEHTHEEQIPALLDPLERGLPVAVVSEAGCPCVADPGSTLVKAAHERGFRVRPLMGSSSIILALMASGFGGQNFAFLGYLPVKERELMGKIKSLESRAWKEGQTQIFIETPYRNVRTFKAIIGACRGETLLCVASDLTGEGEIVKTLPVWRWQEEPLPAIDKVPTVFLLAHG